METGFAAEPQQGVKESTPFDKLGCNSTQVPTPLGASILTPLPIEVNEKDGLKACRRIGR